MNYRWTLLLAVNLLLNLCLVSAEEVEDLSSTSPQDAYVFTELDEQMLEEDVFAKISKMTQNTAMQQGYSVRDLTQDDYVALLPQVIKAVESSDTYLPGSLSQMGDMLVWQTTVGMPCCYDPRMEEKLNHSPEPPSEDTIAMLEEKLQELVSDKASFNGATVENPAFKRVGLIQPYWESETSYKDENFKYCSPYYKAVWEELGSLSEYEGIRHTMTNATIENVARTIESCGLVLIDSHGNMSYTYDNNNEKIVLTSYICLTTSVGITSYDTLRKEGEYGPYFNAIKGGNYAYVNGECIANHMDYPAECSLIYIGSCHGMASDGLFSGLQNKGVEAVWGYSKEITIRGDLLYMMTIMDGLKSGSSFGEAVAVAKDMHGHFDPMYSDYYNREEAVLKGLAFPVCVSAEDEYPGQEHVHKAQTVNSLWTLYEKPILQVEESMLGNATVDRFTVTAYPNEGYYASGYVIVEGNANVLRVGNKFHVDPYTNCTMRILYEKKTPMTITFHDNGNLHSIDCLSGDMVTLPSSEYSFDGWTFAGWSTQGVSSTNEKPVCHAPGEQIYLQENTTLYAVYIRHDGCDQLTYQLVTDDLDDWTGQYVITWRKTDEMHVLHGLDPGDSYHLAFDHLETPFVSTGMRLEGNLLQNVAERFVFDIKRSPDKDTCYTIRNQELENYVANKGGKLRSFGTYMADVNDWTLGIRQDGTVTIQSNAQSDCPYLAYQQDKSKFVAAQETDEMYLWREISAKDTWYTTTPHPMIISQPTDAYANASGKVAKTKVIAQGDELTYQWYLKNPGGTKFSKSSVISDTYSAKLTSASNGRQIYCVITDKYNNTVQSETVKLSIKLEITNQPKDVSVPLDAIALTQVMVEGDGLTYQWYLKNRTGTKFSKSSITSDTYSVKMSQAVDGRQIYCVISDQYGNTATSDTATLSICPFGIVSQPQDVYVENGKKAMTYVKATGEDLTYQWYLKNKTGTKFSKSSIAKDTYSVIMSDAVDGRQIYCVVTNKDGFTITSKTVTLNKYVPLSITTQPTNVSVPIGEKASTSVIATGSDLTYQWYVKNKTAAKFSKSSITKRIYSTTMSDTVDGRQIYCIITDSLGNTLQTNTVTLSKK